MHVIPIVKVVSETCNLRCIYCYYRDGNQNKIQLMSLNVLTELIKKTVAEIKGKATFIWHGGEPLLAGRSFYQDILEIQSKYREDDYKVINGIQTNGIALDEKWASFFFESHFRVGVSCDGPKKYHDKNRLLINGLSSFDRVYNGICELKKFNLNPHIISVITRSSLKGAREIYEFFKSNQLSFHPKPCSENGCDGLSTEYSISPDEYTDFMIEIFDLWWKDDNPQIKIRNLFNILIGLRGGRPNLCESNGDCHLFLTIEPNGDVGPCDSFLTGKYLFGNIERQSWKEILSGPSYNKYLKDIENSRKFCSGCEWLSVCNGGCLRYSFDEGQDKWTENQFCKSKIRLFKYIRERVCVH
ncbi:MAG: SPASM domain-containing protein [Candidatus Roizmanbacteria bacterium]|nr:SPASM domain-containing protein [Candidatus Roizmanbacteria bacterium]